jgi:DNA (cytosine-5)-methyltransferase 1
MKLKVLDLFSGIGGFSLGLESTGFFETIGFVEKDNFCQKVLKKHWSNINIEGDIRNVKGERYAADVVTGGFPCQPFSVAGKRKSTADDRYLWDEMLRVIREVKPRWVIGENVEGIVNINEGMVLRQVLDDLENEGFKSQCIIIPASGIGAWHQRKRIWIIANNISNTNKRNVQTGCERQWGICKENKRKGTSNNATSVCETLSNSNTRLSIRENEEIQSRGNATTNGSEDVSNSDSRMCRGWGTEFKSGDDREWGFYIEKEKQTREYIRCKTIGCNAVLGKDVPNSKSFVSNGGEYGNDSKEEQIQFKIGREDSNGNVFNTNDKRCEEFNFLSESEREIINHRRSDESRQNKTWWEIESEFCGVPNGVSYELDKDRSNRIKSLGNSIVPQIVRQIGLSILTAEGII